MTIKIESGTDLKGGGRDAGAGPGRHHGKSETDTEGEQDDGQRAGNDGTRGHCSPGNPGYRRLSGIDSGLNDDCIDHDVLPARWRKNVSSAAIMSRGNNGSGAGTRILRELAITRFRQIGARCRRALRFSALGIFAPPIDVLRGDDHSHRHRVLYRSQLSELWCCNPTATSERTLEPMLCRRVEARLSRNGRGQETEDNDT